MPHAHQEVRPHTLPSTIGPKRPVEHSERPQGRPGDLWNRGRVTGGPASRPLLASTYVWSPRRCRTGDPILTMSWGVVRLGVQSLANLWHGPGIAVYDTRPLPSGCSVLVELALPDSGRQRQGAASEVATRDILALRGRLRRRASAPPMKSVPTGVESSGVSWVIQVGVGMRWNSWVLIRGLGRAALASTRHRGYRNGWQRSSLGCTVLSGMPVFKALDLPCVAVVVTSTCW